MIKTGNRSKLNLITGVFYQVINTGMGLILPYLFITNFGSETNGLLNSISQLFVYLELLEAGVGSAAQQALYKPITEQNKSGINRIMSATQRYYIKTGVLYVVLMCLAAIIFPYIISSSLPKVTIIKIVLLQGLGSVWSYFFQAKYIIFLRAEGKVYVLNSVKLTITILRNAGKIIAIALGYDIVVVMMIQLIVYILQSFIVIVYVRRSYPWLSCKEQPDFKAISQKNAVLLQSVAWVIFNHTDVLLLTVAVQNLALASVYSVYTLVFESIQNMLETIRSGYFYKLGWKGQTSEKDLRAYYIKYESYYVALSSALFFIAYIFVVPFLRLYVGNVKDTDYLMRNLPLLFLIMKLLYSYHDINKQLSDAVGHFKRTQYINIIEMIMNILLSLLLVFRCNIYGVLLGTIIALMFSDILYIYHNAKYVLNTNCLHTIINIIAYTCLGFVMSRIATMYLPSFDSFRQLVIVAIPVSAIVSGAFLVISIAIEWWLEKIYKEK